MTSSPTESRPDLRIPGASEPGGWVAAAGLVIDDATATRVVGHIDVGRQHQQPWGLVHGGLYTLVVETAASVGASVAVRDRQQYAVGLNNSTDFLRATAEGRLQVLAEPVIQGRTQQLWRVTLTRDDGKPVAQGTVRLQNVDMPT